MMNPARFAEAKPYVLRMVLSSLAHNDPAFMVAAREVFDLDPEGVLSVLVNMAGLAAALVSLLARATDSDAEDVVVRMIQEDQ